MRRPPLQQGASQLPPPETRWNAALPLFPEICGNQIQNKASVSTHTEKGVPKWPTGEIMRSTDRFVALDGMHALDRTLSHFCHDNSDGWTKASFAAIKPLWIEWFGFNNWPMETIATLFGITSAFRIYV